MPYGGRTSFFSIPYPTKGNKITEDEERRKFTIIDNQLMASLRGAPCIVFSDGIYSYGETAGVYSVYLSGSGQDVALNAILNFGLARTYSTIQWTGMAAGSVYYLAIEFVETLYENMEAFIPVILSAAPDISDNNHLYLASFDLTGATPVLNGEPEGKLYSKDLTEHILKKDNPHEVTAAQVGNDTAVWNANKFQGKTIPVPGAGDNRKGYLYDEPSGNFVLTNVEPRLITVVDIDNPIELRALSGLYDGEVIFVFQAAVSKNLATTYYWDSDGTASENLPSLIKNTTAGIWVGLSGRNAESVVPRPEKSDQVLVSDSTGNYINKCRPESWRFPYEVEETGESYLFASGVASVAFTTDSRFDDVLVCLERRSTSLYLHCLAAKEGLPYVTLSSFTTPGTGTAEFNRLFRLGERYYGVLTLSSGVTTFLVYELLDDFTFSPKGSCKVSSLTNLYNVGFAGYIGQGNILFMLSNVTGAKRYFCTCRMDMATGIPESVKTDSWESDYNITYLSGSMISDGYFAFFEKPVGFNGRINTFSVNSDGTINKTIISTASDDYQGIIHRLVWIRDDIFGITYYKTDYSLQMKTFRISAIGVISSFPIDSQNFVLGGYADSGNNYYRFRLFRYSDDFVFCSFQRTDNRARLLIIRVLETGEIEPELVTSFVGESSASGEALDWFNSSGNFWLYSSNYKLNYTEVSMKSQELLPIGGQGQAFSFPSFNGTGYDLSIPFKHLQSELGTVERKFGEMDSVREDYATGYPMGLFKLNENFVAIRRYIPHKVKFEIRQVYDNGELSSVCSSWTSDAAPTGLSPYGMDFYALSDQAFFVVYSFSSSSGSYFNIKSFSLDNIGKYQAIDSYSLFVPGYYILKEGGQIFSHGEDVFSAWFGKKVYFFQVAVDGTIEPSILGSSDILLSLNLRKTKIGDFVFGTSDDYGYFLKSYQINLETYTASLVQSVEVDGGGNLEVGAFNGKSHVLVMSRSIDDNIGFSSFLVDEEGGFSDEVDAWGTSLDLTVDFRNVAGNKFSLVGGDGLVCLFEVGADGIFNKSFLDVYPLKSKASTDSSKIFFIPFKDNIWLVHHSNNTYICLCSVYINSIPPSLPPLLTREDANSNQNKLVATNETGTGYILLSRDNVQASIKTVFENSVSISKEDYTILMETGDTDRFCLLPPVSAGIAGFVFNVKKIDSGTGKVVVAGLDLSPIDGLTGCDIVGQWDSYSFQSDGTNWYIL